MVDAGVGAAARARALLDLGARRVIVGTETLSGPDALDRLLAELPERTVILGLDLREGRALSLDPELAGRPALDALARLPAPGCTRRSCSTSRAWAAARARTSR